jgi:TBC1 domain family protein 5
MDAAAQVVAYQRLFNADSSPARLRELALNGGLRAAGLRSVCWKVFFGVIPHGATLVDWAKALDASRKAYDAHKDKILVDPHKNAEDKDLLTNNPLAQAEDSSWKRYFELQELQKDIQIDLERLNFDDPLFAEDGPHFQRVQGIMLRILTVWSSLNPSISYRQGMHELLAPLLAVVERDCQQGAKSPAESDAGLIGCVTDSTFTEHDGYALFEKLMEVVSESFAPQERKKEKDGQYARPGGVVARCDRMQNTLLRSKDYELYIHLQSQHIEPQLYSMKWIRLLLGREFHLEDVLLLWDAMFADHHETCIKGTKTLAGGRGLELLEYVCIAMLVYIRADLLGKDNMGCLQRLMKYPPVEDVKVFIKSALTFRDSTTTPTPELRQQQQQPPLPAAPPPHTAAPLPADPPPVAAAPPNPTTAPPAMHRAGNSGGGGGGSSSTSWLLGGSSSSGLAVAGGGAAAAPANPPAPRSAGGHVAFVGGQVVHLGADAAAQASSAPISRYLIYY